MKKKIYFGLVYAVLAFCMAFAFVACGGGSTSSYTMSKDSYSMSVGDTYRLGVYAGDEYVSTGVVWSSSDDSVVSVSTIGMITAVDSGSATITATIEEESVTCTITVSDAYALTGDASVAMYAYTSALELTCNSTAVSSGITWKSSDETIATVTDGIVHGESVGSATITATTSSGSASMEISVSNATVSLNMPTVAVKDTVTLTTALELYINGTLQTSVDWVSADATIASVASGYITGESAGFTTITGTADNGASATCSVEIESVTVVLNADDATMVTLKKGDPLVLEAAAGAGAITWSSDDDSIASIASDGTVTGNTIMEEVTLSGTDGTDTYECALLVVPVESLKEAGTMDLNKGTTGSESMVGGDYYVYGDSSSVLWATSAKIDNGVFTFETKENTGMTQLRFLPATAAGETYVGAYSVVYTVTNNTTESTVASANRNGESTSDLVKTTIKAGKTHRFVTSAHTTSATSQQMNLKFTGIGDGELVISDFYFILDGNPEVFETRTQAAITGSETNTGDWYYNGNTFDTYSMTDGVISIYTADTFSSTCQIRNKPLCADGVTEYVGRYAMTFTLVNNTDASISWSANVNTQSGSTSGTVSAGATSVKSYYTFTSDGTGQQLNLKIKNSGVGTLLIKDISWILLDEYTDSTLA